MSKIQREYWGSKDGKEVYLFTFTNKNGTIVRVSNFGGVIVSICVADKRLSINDVVLGLGGSEDYLTRNHTFFGSILGRCAGRIDRGKMNLNGTCYSLPVHHKIGCHYNGGEIGFSRRVWEPKLTANGQDSLLELSYFSPDGEEGYPGNVRAQVFYRLGEDDSLRIDYHAKTDAATPVNLTNQIYFNLSGHDAGSIRNHELKMYSSRFTPVGERVIPTGEIRSVAGTCLDFSEFRSIGTGLDAPDEQLRLGLGYDHNWVLNNAGSLNLAAELYAPDTGRLLQVYTTAPGIHLYTANVMNLPSKNIPNTKDGAVYTKYCSACLMPQHYPDAVNHPNFPSPVLQARKNYEQTNVYRFSVRG